MSENEFSERNIAVHHYSQLFFCWNPSRKWTNFALYWSQAMMSITR